VQAPMTGSVLLQGNVSDGSGVQHLQVRVDDPNGNVYTETALLSNGAWSYTPTASLMVGRYSLRVFATDVYGNVSVAGAFDLEVQGPPGASKLYFPTIARDSNASINHLYLPEMAKEGVVPLPDVVVQSLTVAPAASLRPGAAVISVVIRNTGNASALGFWVDFYVDPKRSPQTHETWPSLCNPAWPNPNCYGGSWFVSTLAAGQVMTLSSESLINDAQYSHWTGEFATAGPHTLYALADVLDTVNEGNEGNNRFGPVTVSAVARDRAEVPDYIARYGLVDLVIPRRAPADSSTR
jgi:CARDB/Bacterial Ig-like domain